MAHVAAVLDREGAPAGFARCVRHAILLGALDHAAASAWARLGLLTRWLGLGDADGASSLRERADWHRDQLVLRRRQLVAGCIRSGLPRVVAREALDAFRRALQELRAVLGGGVWGHDEAIQAAEEARVALAALLGGGPSHLRAPFTNPPVEDSPAHRWARDLAPLDTDLRALRLESVGRGTFYVVGLTELRTAVDHWLARGPEVLGPLPTAADTLATYAARRLARRETFGVTASR